MNAGLPVGNRRLVHTRHISCTAYERADGLLDIEGHLVDSKPFPLELSERGALAPGAAIHEMLLCLTVDRGLTIRDVRARTMHAPYGICGAIGDSYRQLIGLQIGRGFVRHVKSLFRGVAGCSHLTELLSPIATTAYQALWGDPLAKGRDGRFAASLKTPSPVDGCHALRSDGEIVRSNPQRFQQQD